jgi:hypothetical protein
VKARTAEKQAEHAGEYTLGRTRYDAAGKPIVTAPPEEMSEADKARIANEDRRIELEGRRADQTEAYQRAQLAQGAAGQAETAGYHKTEAGLARQRLEVERQNAGTPKTEDERRDKRMLDYSAAVAAGKTPTAEQVAQHERDYREAGQQATGRHRYPAAAFDGRQAAPQPGVTRDSIAYPQKMVDEARTAHAGYASGTSAIDNTTDLLNHATPTELANPTSEVGARVRAEALAVQSALGQAQNAGVLQQGDIQRYEAVLGDLTGPMAGLKAAGGVKQAQAALAEIKGMLRTGVEAKLPRVVSEGQLGGVSLGMTFLAPNGHLYRRDGPGKDDFTDLDAGRK